MPSQPREERAPIREADVEGLKYFRKLWPLFERRHEVGCQRDKAAKSPSFPKIVIRAFARFSR